MPTHDDLASWQAIHDLITAGAQAQDRHDWDFYGNTFSPNARYVHPKGEIRGREAIVARSVAALEPLDASQHLVGSIMFAQQPQVIRCSWWPGHTTMSWPE